MMSSLPPGSLLLLCAPLLALLRGRALQVALVLLPLLSLAHLLLGFGTDQVVNVGGWELVRVDGLSRVFGIVFHLAAVASSIFSLGVVDKKQHVAALAYAGAAIGAVFAGHLVPLFFFWELTAVTSVVLVWATGTKASFAAGLRYLVVQVLSGVLLLGAILLRGADGLSLEMGPIGLDGSWSSGLLFVAFGIKAAFPFLHPWLQDAYPQATPTGSVWLSAFTTKLAIYALARCFAGTEILVPIGVVMTAFPIFFAVIENDLRKVLAYSLNNQLGYMVVGVGIGSELALNGVAAHAFAHILYKGLLFMAMGAVLLRTGTTKGSELGGLYRTMPWTTTFCIVGALAISGFPLLSGFVSKSMIVSAAAEEHLTLTYLALLFASAGVFHHSGIKIPFFAFFAHDSGKRPQEAPPEMLVGMGLLAALCVLLGAAPGLLYGLLPYPVDYVPYTADHVVQQLQLLLGSAFAFGVLQRIGAYPPELRSTVLDVDWLWRRGAPAVLLPVVRWVEGLAETLAYARTRVARAAIGWLGTRAAPSARWARTGTSGTATLTVAVVLTFYALLFFSLGGELQSGPAPHGGAGAHELPVHHGP